MKKLSTKDILYISIFFLFVFGYIVFLYTKGYIFGSRIDWANQHTVIPEYFRNLFYSNGKLFPSLALNLGMGQNIYNFSYYGLFSPVILISYLVPFIPMYYYIPLACIISLLVSIIMFYTWIKNKYNSNVAFISSLLFILNSTFIYHFHRHIMFVIYMPFVIGALKSIDLYLKEKRPISLIIYTILLIFTSYYFSVSGILVIGIYTIFRLLEHKKFNYKPLIKVIFFVSVAILISGILLIPTISSLTNGRVPTLTSSTPLIDLLNPRNNIEYTFYYSYYSWGITLIYIISIISGFLSKKKNYIFLSGVLALTIVFPINSYLLNGLMYIDGKCFLPFLPIALLLVSDFINNAVNKKIDLLNLVKYTALVSCLLILLSIGKSTLYILIIDAILMLSTLIIYPKIKNKYLLFIPAVLIAAASFGISAMGETYLKLDTLKQINNPIYYELSDIKDEKNLYRVANDDNNIDTPNKIYNVNNLITTMYSSSSNGRYFSFIRDTFQNEIINRDNTTITNSSNIIFNLYSATKYLISSNNVPIGYKEVKTLDNISLYENNDVLPLVYASDKIMSKREFDTLKYPYTLDALLNYTIVDTSIDNVYHSNVDKFKADYTITNVHNLEYTKEDDHYIISAGSNASLTVFMNKTINNKILILKFNMNKTKEGFACSSNITINGITNALSCSNWKYHNNNYTFEYVLSSNEPFNNLEISFTEGNFDISDIELYTINYSTLRSINKNIDPVIIDQINSTNDKIIGTVTASKDGFVKTTIPYEKYAFDIYVDGEKVDNRIIDNTFVGFEITQGTHNIIIKYTSPYFRQGLICSLIGVFILCLIIIYKYTKKQVDKAYKKTIKYLTKILKKIIKFLKNNKGYILLFISLIILDLSLRIYYNRSVNYYHWYYLVPNLFTINWLILILVLSKFLTKIYGKLIYILYYVFTYVMFLVHAIYFSYFNTFFDYSVLSVAGEGADYFDSVIPNIKIWIVLISIVSITLTVMGLKRIKHDKHINIKRIIIALLVFTTIEFILPPLLGSKRKEVEWDDWRNARQIYTSFNDNNKSMMVAGLNEYNFRNFVVNYLKDNNKVTEEEQKAMDENFADTTVSIPNKYTGLFKGKNLILIQLESIDDFLVNKNIMPELYKISKNSINFTDHYSFTAGGGSTFNSEYMVNTGYSSAYNYNQSAYIFSKNSYTYSLPNLFKAEGYTVNAFHMNNAEYYSRAVNYKAFGFDSYNGLKDQNIYQNLEFWLDTELVKNETFNNLMFNTEQPFVSYIITYSAHMPFKTTKGTCSLLTEEEGLTEWECLKLQAKETDDFIKLLIQNLKEKDLLDNTVIVLFADHYVYSLEDKSILDKYKETSNNLINHTPFMIFDNYHKWTVKATNSQLDILPTLLNLFGMEYTPNNYIGRDILDPKYDPIVFFPDGSWYNGQTYVANGEYQFGKKMSQTKIDKYNLIVKKKMLLNDGVIKSDYFKK